MGASTLADAKAAQRTASRRARHALSMIDRARASARLVARLVTLPEVASASTIALYAALPDEADPFDAVDYLARHGTRILLPRVEGRDIELVRFTDVRTLQRGFMGVAEPPGDPVDPAEVEVIVVPGLAFDLSGGRLGQGGGHYDRLLGQVPTTTVRVGLCLHAQLVDAVPRGDDDESVDVVVTDAGVWRTGARA